MCYCALKSGTEKYLKSSLGQREKHVLVKLYTYNMMDLLKSTSPSIHQLQQIFNSNKHLAFVTVSEMKTLHTKIPRIRACDLVGNSNFSVS